MAKTKIISQGQFTAIGMRAKVEDPTALVINTCGQNDTAEKGNPTSWVWCNPTNRAISHLLEDYVAVSVECLWQGTKIFQPDGLPNPETLGGSWRKGKGKRPVGAWVGKDQPLVKQGEARRKIYIPAFKRLVEHWLKDQEVAGWVEKARNHPGPVYLRDHDTGRGIDRNGPMSHAWLLCEFLNNGVWPD